MTNHTLLQSVNYSEKWLAEEVHQPDPGSLDRTIWYLPHHAANRDDKRTTESRIAFNASAKGKDSVSLNDCVFPGTAQQPNLAPVLIRLRAH